ncbi:MAG: DUF1080 domain-containing protein [Planctomycetota bacterium]|nr:DUF1080 domain-containing protein [Planctomycetota bacterium]
MNIHIPTSTLLMLIACFISFGCSSLPWTAEESAPVIPLFNGEDLTGWYSDVPAADGGKDVDPSFVVEDGLLISKGNPQGHLISEDSYKDYQLVVEYRWAAKPGNCGILVHASTPRRLYAMFPQSIECQLHVGNAGDFWCIGEDIHVDDMIARRGPADKWGVDEDKNRRILNLTDNSENPIGDWNRMVIQCRADTIHVWLNGELVNFGFNCTASQGQIAIQAEGAPVQFRRIDMTSLVDTEL